MFCTKCGAPNPDGAKFCVKCAAPMASVQPRAGQQPAPQPAPAPKRRSKAPLVVGVVALVALLAAGGFYLVSSGTLGSLLGSPASSAFASVPYMDPSFYDRPASEVIAALEGESFEVDEIWLSDEGEFVYVNMTSPSTGDIFPRASSEEPTRVNIAYRLPDGFRPAQIESVDDIPATAEISSASIEYSADLLAEELVPASREVVEWLGPEESVEYLSASNDELYDQLVAEYGEPAVSSDIADVDFSYVIIGLALEDYEVTCLVSLFENAAGYSGSGLVGVSYDFNN